MRLQLILPRVEPTEMKQPIGKSHVKRNTQGMIEDLKPRAEQDEDGSLSATAIAPQQATADLEWLEGMMEARMPQDASTRHPAYRRGAVSI